MGKQSVTHAAAVVVCLAGMAAASEKRDAVDRLYQAALANPGDDVAFQAYLDTLPKYRGAFVAEGDLLLSEQELRTALAQRATATPPVKGGELIVNTENGVPTFWKDPAVRTLTFAVDRASFPEAERYDLVVKNLKKAAGEWQKACGNCGLTLTYKPEHDAAPSLENVTFIARQVDAGGAFIAAAFFPNDPPADRFMDVDPSYFSTRFDGVGVFRHELGPRARLPARAHPGRSRLLLRGPVLAAAHPVRSALGHALLLRRRGRPAPEDHGPRQERPPRALQEALKGSAMPSHTRGKRRSWVSPRSWRWRDMCSRRPCRPPPRRWSRPAPRW